MRDEFYLSRCCKCVIDSDNNNSVILETFVSYFHNYELNRGGSMHFSYACTWAKGEMETINRESFSLQTVLTGSGPFAMVAVAEGLGDSAKGAYAGGFAVSIMTTWFYEHALPALCTHKSYACLVRSFKRAMGDVHQQLQKEAGAFEIALESTFTLLLLSSKKYYLFELGGGHCFKIGPKVTEISRNGLKRTNKKGMVPLGNGKSLSIFCKKGEYRKNERFLVCSSGFMKCINSQSIVALKNSSTEESLRRLLNEIVSRGRRKGVKENCTGIVLGRTIGRVK